VSSAPVVATHTAAERVYRHARGKSDEELVATAATGGVVGVVTLPDFLGPGPGVTIEATLDHMDHMVRRIGWEHVGIGTDWPMANPAW
jgi:membrane dipeptidase